MKQGQWTSDDSSHYILSPSSSSLLPFCQGHSIHSLCVHRLHRKRVRGNDGIVRQGFRYLDVYIQRRAFRRADMADSRISRKLSHQFHLVNIIDRHAGVADIDISGDSRIPIARDRSIEIDRPLEVFCPCGIRLNIVGEFQSLTVKFDDGRTLLDDIVIVLTDIDYGYHVIRCRIASGRRVRHNSVTA